MDVSNCTRRDFLKSVAFALSSFVLPRAGISRENPPPPNIVFILADDQGLHQIGCYGNSFYETPNLDRLAAEGMKFTDAYAACPVCSPTRASIVTGKYPARLHLTDFIWGHPIIGKLKVPPWRKYLPDEEVTIPEALKPAGYISGHFGKWHLNKNKNYAPGRPMDPGSQGFDDVLTNDKPLEDADPKADPHHVWEITNRATSFIESNKNRPFFCYVAHNSIHDPKMECLDIIAKYKKKAGSEDPKNNPVIAAMVETLDRSFGVILDKLEELKIADNTIVVYFSDNGCNHASDELKPLRGGKAQLYEGGIRVPLIIRWPAVVRAGTKCRTAVSSVDFFPTFLETARLKITDATAVDGESLLPLLTQTGSLKRDALYWHYPHYHYSGIAPSGAVRAGRYKLIEWFEKSIDGIDTPGAIELFDIEADISEQQNLAEKMPDITAKLYNQLKQWRKSVGAQEMLLDRDYKTLP